MSDPVGADDLVYVAQAHVPQKEIQAVDEKKEPHIPINEKETTVVSTVPSIHNVHDDGREYPTEEEERTLRRVSDSVSWTAYTVAFVELCERFSYYGTTAVYVNFIQQPLPAGSTTGAGYSGQSGALGQGERTSTALTTFNTFWCYVMPILGAWIADEYWGQQYKETRLFIKTIPKTGERVIVDPAQTITRIFLYFYFMINVGSLIGSVAMVYAEKYVGYWLAFLLPTIMFGICPIVLFFCRKRYTVTPPTGSVVTKAFQLWSLALRGQWSWNPVTFYHRCKSTEFWDSVKPSRLANKPTWMTFDDQWVEEVRRAVKACAVFAWYPLYWLAYGQMTNNLTSQAATMQLHGVPNDIINNLDPLALIIFIPIMDQFIYPGLRKMGFHFTPIKRIYVGYLLASASMIAAAVTQYYIYKLSPCGNHPSSCDEAAPINVWVQAVPYVLIAFSEIFASITGYEYAYTKAPKNMKSLVQSLYLFMNAISSAIQQGLTALSTDPLLIWNYGFVAVLAFVGGNLFFLCNLKLDKEEDELNNIEESAYLGRNVGDSGKVEA
ncbi:hypothetical protein CAN33_0042585 [Aspergillus niger]|uniref:MFS peptide transporter n=1 Tax=Aspergillus niger TaxID=5061 RepID=A0A505HTV2_ASPNG|nr:hypothetical protein CAN33_0042585 [Aspergillus niger]